MTVTIRVDVGTQWQQAGVYLDDGTCVGTGHAEHAFTYPAVGWVEMDPGQIEDAVLAALAAAVAQAAAAGVVPARVGTGAFGGILCGPGLTVEAAARTDLPAGTPLVACTPLVAGAAVEPVGGPAAGRPGRRRDRDRDHPRGRRRGRRPGAYEGAGDALQPRHLAGVVLLLGLSRGRRPVTALVP